MMTQNVRKHLGNYKIADVSPVTPTSPPNSRTQRRPLSCSAASSFETPFATAGDRKQVRLFLRRFILNIDFCEMMASYSLFQSESSSPSTDSKWNKVKKAFLPAPTSTSSAAGTATEDSSRSLPSSPSRNASVFFYGDVAKSEKNSSSRLIRDGRYQSAPLADPSLHHLDLIREYSRGSSECSGSTNLNRIQSEIQKDYEQLQRSISQEFHRYSCIIARSLLVSTSTHFQCNDTR